jgi:hypothetical protein
MTELKNRNGWQVFADPIRQGSAIVAIEFVQGTIRKRNRLDLGKRILLDWDREFMTPSDLHAIAAEVSRLNRAAKAAKRRAALLRGIVRHLPSSH